MISESDARHLECVREHPFTPIGWLYSDIFRDLGQRGLVKRAPGGGYIISAHGAEQLKTFRAAPQRWSVWITVEHWAAVNGGHDWHGTQEEALAKVEEWTKNGGQALPPGVKYEAKPYTGDDPADEEELHDC